MKTGNLVSRNDETVAAGRGSEVRRLDCARQSAADRSGGPIVVIDRCEPARRFLVRCLQEVTDGANVVAFASICQWLEVAQGYKPPKVVLICNSDHDDPDGEIAQDLSRPEILAEVPVFVVPSTDVMPPLTEQRYRRSQIAACDGSIVGKRSTSREATKQGEGAVRRTAPVS